MLKALLLGNYLIICILIISALSSVCHAQNRLLSDSNVGKNKAIPNLLLDTLKAIPDSMIRKFTSIQNELKDNITSSYKTTKQSSISSFSNLKPDSILKSFVPGFSQKSLFTTKPLLKVNGGYVAYNMYYRGYTDTPIVEKNILQNSINGSLNFAVANIPFRLNYLFQRSNSVFYRNSNDVQLIFDVPQFHQMINKNTVQQILQKAILLKDSLTGKLSELKLDEYFNLSQDFNSRFNLQNLIEAKEMLNVPELSWDITLPDSLARLKSDSLKRVASTYINLYEKATENLNRIKSSADSLKSIYEESLLKVKQLQDLATGKVNNLSDYKKLLNDPALINSGIGLVPPKYRWLMGVRKFIVGRSALNTSELTAKNMSLSGINFEYNSKYYYSISAGLIDYRFRDFIIHKPNNPKLYFFMGRVGIGTIDKNFIIFSLYKGQKQVYSASNVYNIHAINVTGISVEAKYQINKLSYIKAEIAESVAPDLRSIPIKTNQWNLKDKFDKAFAISAHFIIPKTQTKFDGVYKYVGPKFQSFSSFQTSSSLNYWNIRLEQNFFKRHLRIIGAIKSNEFSNPYLIQTYQSNTVFKSAQAYFRKNKWPLISIGYMPTMQLTNMGGNIIENRFNSLNATTYHFYKMIHIKAATTFIYSKFYNTSADSGFIYFNASNLFAKQMFYFNGFNAAINISHSTNKNYELNVLEENLQFPIKKIGTFLFGVKINNLNKLYTKVGVYGNIQISLLKNSIISLQYEDGYIPGMQGTLVRNSIGSIQLSKNF